jgi:hypothetical protein
MGMNKDRFTEKGTETERTAGREKYSQIREEIWKRKKEGKKRTKAESK